MTNYMIGYRGNNVERLIEVDIRGNSKPPKIDKINNKNLYFE